MKKCLLIIMCSMILALSSCNIIANKSSNKTTINSNKTTISSKTTLNNTTKEEDKMSEENQKIMNLVTPFYETDIMYDETLILVAETDDDGNIISNPCGNLLFTPDEIIEVKQYFHVDNKDVVYFELGKDFTVEGKTITVIGDVTEDIFGVRNEVNTKMPYVTDKQVTGESPFPGVSGSLPSTTDGLNIPFDESYNIIQMQISVTYKHSEKWTKYTPVSQNESLKNVVAKLNNKEDVELFVYGDSISTGCNSSGYLNIRPYLEPWYELVKDGLEITYGSKVNVTNKSVAGWTSSQGVSLTEQTGYLNGQTIKQAGLSSVFNNELKDYSPDLAIIAFGMNDACCGVTLNNYAKNIMKMIDILLERNPNCDIILIGTMLPNPTSKNQASNQSEFAALNDKIANEYKDKANVVSVNISKIHQDMLDSGKKYIDMIANNVNHPNDFFARVYAMNILDTIWE